MARQRHLLRLVLCAAGPLLAGCTSSPPAGAAGTASALAVAPTAPSGIASATASSSVAATAASRTISGVHSPREVTLVGLDNTVAARWTEAGVRALTLKAASDSAVVQPLVLVTFDRDPKAPPERTALPFAINDLVAGNLSARRFAYTEGPYPRLRLHLWGNGQDSVVPLESTYKNMFKDGAVATTQALITTGKLDRAGNVLWPTERRAARYRGGVWSWIELPGLPEKGWSGCHWSVADRPGSDDFVLMQTCAAPRRELAYAVYRLGADSDEVSRVPFDNELFDPVRASRGTFEVEDDGTIDIGNDNPGAMTIARLRPGRDAWEILRIEIPTRLMSSTGLYGEHVIVTDGEGAVRVSSDGGKTFQAAAGWRAPGMLGNCNAQGCLFLGDEPGTGLPQDGRPSKVFLRFW